MCTARVSWSFLALEVVLIRSRLRNYFVVLALDHDHSLHDSSISLRNGCPGEGIVTFILSTSLGPALGDIDGVNQWSAIVGATKSNRTEFLVNIDQKASNAALRMGPWKLYQGMFVSELQQPQSF